MTRSVLIISPTQGQGHGAETVLCHMLSAWADAEITIRLMAPRGSRVLEVAQNLKIDTLEFKTGKDSIGQNLRAALASLRDRQCPSLVHAWSARSFECAVLIAQRRGIPCSGTMHDHPRASFHGIVRQRLMRNMANRFAGLACVSDALGAETRKANYCCPLTVIHNGLIDPAGGPVHRQDSDKVRIAFLGMYAAWKGFNVVRELAGRMRELPVTWHLFGSIHRSYEASVRQLLDQHSDRVFVMGHERIDKILAEADIVLHPSTAFDPLPTVLIESARAGIPSVCSSLGGGPEIVVDGVTGYVFSPANLEAAEAGLRALILSPVDRHRLGIQARNRFSEMFQVTRMAEEYAAFWKSIASKGDK